MNKITDMIRKVFHTCVSNGEFLIVDNNYSNVSVPKTITGNTASTDIAVPSSGNKLTIKGITINGEGNTGTAKLKRSSDDETVLVVYFSNFNKQGVSASINLRLAEDEKIYAVLASRGETNETFIGITYIE